MIKNRCRKTNTLLSRNLYLVLHAVIRYISRSGFWVGEEVYELLQVGELCEESWIRKGLPQLQVERGSGQY